MLWSIVVIIPITGFFVKKAIDYFYPNKINEIIKKKSLKYGWIVLDKVSRCEIYMSKLWFTYKHYIPLTFNPNKQQLIFVKNGEEIVKMNFDDYIEEQIYKDFSTKYDFILHHIPIENTDKYDKYDSCYKRYNDVNTIAECRVLKSPKCIQFTMVVLSIKNSDKTYCIDYGRNQFNINGNVLYDRSFLNWVLKKYHNLSMNENDEYTLTFIDHNMNYVTIPNTCYILIENDDYKIVNDDYKIVNNE
jgi:hypothetical protein